MNDSSEIFAPSTTLPWTDDWSNLELIHTHGQQQLYCVQQYGRRFILKATSSTEAMARQRLQKEFTLGMQLDHPNIVHTLDYGHDPKIGDYIRLEWIDGMTLSDFLTTKPSAAIRMKLLHQLLEAVEHLHAHQIIHRDLKPSNILVTHNGNNLKLIDFGLSDSDDFAAIKQPSGTLSYIAPEQLTGTAVDCRADIYSFGKILSLLFPRHYRYIARVCTKNNPHQRYADMAAVERAIRRADRWRHSWPLWIGILSLLASLTLSLYIYLRPDPREKICNLAKEQVEQEYQHLLATYPPCNDLVGANAAILDFYNGCAHSRDSISATIQDETLRNDFISTSVITTGKKAQDYMDLCNKD